MSSTERKFTTILAMNVVDYSKKMGKNEEVKVKSLKACKIILEETAKKFHGRIFNTAGNAFMIEFSSPVSAVFTASETQKNILKRNQTMKNIETAIL